MATRDPRLDPIVDVDEPEMFRPTLLAETEIQMSGPEDILVDPTLPTHVIIPERRPQPPVRAPRSEVELQSLNKVVTGILDRHPSGYGPRPNPVIMSIDDMKKKLMERRMEKATKRMRPAMEKLPSPPRLALPSLEPDSDVEDEEGEGEDIFDW